MCLRSGGGLHQNPSIIWVHLCRTKTDLFGAGVSIYIGKTGTSLCPVSVLLNFMAVFPQGKGPLFMHEDNSPVTRSRFVQHAKCMLQLANIDAIRYSGHSYRIGAATAAAVAGGFPHTLSGCWGRGRARPTTRTSIPQENPWHRCLKLLSWQRWGVNNLTCCLHPSWASCSVCFFTDLYCLWLICLSELCLLWSGAVYYYKGSVNSNTKKRCSANSNAWRWECAGA